MTWACWAVSQMGLQLVGVDAISTIVSLFTSTSPRQLYLAHMLQVLTPSNTAISEQSRKELREKYTLREASEHHLGTLHLLGTS